jgi:hypothetical protein
MHHVITFDPHGQGHCLYTEALDLAAIGPLAIERATTIEFDNQSQRWEVRDPAGALMYQDPSRNACLAWEHQFLNR